jgi:hypothetical protein
MVFTGLSLLIFSKPMLTVYIHRDMDYILMFKI